MAEPSETPPPRPPKGPPGGYLPRLRHPDAEEAPTPSRDEPPSGRAKAKAKSGSRKPEPEGPGKPGDTPSFETYEGRRAVRFVVGLVAAGLLLWLGYSLVRAVGGGGGEVVYDLPDHYELAPRAPEVDPNLVELEARQMFQQARLAATNGNTEGAVSMLATLAGSYPRTDAGRRAKEALARPDRGLPLFVEGDAVGAEGPPPAPEVMPPTPPPPAIEATAPGPPASTPGAPGAEVAIVPPTRPAEPPKPEASALEPAADVPSKPLPDGFRARPEAGAHASGWPLAIVGDRDGATMVLVPGGTFIMGRDDGPAAEGPSHQVRLSTYYIDQHEVTVRQFDRFRLATDPADGPTRPADGPTRPTDGPTPEAEADRPVVRVSARDAAAYARWAGKALPTEAQWEMAARTPDGRITPWGPGPAPWDRTRETKQIDPVMAFPGDLSPSGAFDLAGNAWEWTSDWYDSTYYRQFRNAEAVDPTGPSRSRSRPPQLTIKGGSPDWLSSWREPLKVDAMLPHLGFRCALPVDQVARPADGPSARPPTRGGVVPF